MNLTDRTLLPPFFIGYMLAVLALFYFRNGFGPSQKQSEEICKYSSPFSLHRWDTKRSHLGGLVNFDYFRNRNSRIHILYYNNSVFFAGFEIVF
jgi:hypothetical protein